VARNNYNQYGLLTNKVEDTSQAVFRYTYDAGGRLSTRWTPQKGTTTYHYDPVGNLTNVDYPSSTDLTLQYDALNRLTNLVDAVGTTRYTWTASGQLLSEDGPWSDDTVSYTYQQRQRTGLSVAQPNAAAWSQSYGYDVAKRLTNITSSAGAFGYEYGAAQPSTLVARLTLPGGNWITNELDSVGRVKSTILYNPAASPVNAHSYTYDLAGERTKQTRTDGSFVDYGYDKMGQLLTAQGKESGGTTRWHEQFGYAYDPAGNLNWRTNNDLAAVPSEQPERTNERRALRQRHDRRRHHHQRRDERHREHPHGAALRRLHLCPHQRQPQRRLEQLHRHRAG
jgi:YD repeat-containing protein